MNSTRLQRIVPSLVLFVVLLLAWQVAGPVFGIRAYLLPSPAAVFADDSDIFGANIQPNVLIMIDDSGSMADAAPSDGT